MKAITNLTRTKKILTTGILFTFFAISVYGQGLLAESAMKLFRADKPVTEQPEPEFYFVNFTLSDSKVQEDSFGLMEKFINLVSKDAEDEVNEELTETNISKTIFTSDVNVTYEDEMKAESWMSTLFSTGMESQLVSEQWMMESFLNLNEDVLETEAWMTRSLSGSLEAELVVEDWMTQPLTATQEQKLETENWMTQPLDEVLEQDIETEDWMTQPLSDNMEYDLVTEDWMTEPFETR